MDIKETLKTLTGAAGVSGDELSASEKAAELLKKYAEDVCIDAFGSVTGVVRSDRPGAKTLMLDAHVDRVGLIVTYIDEKGFIGVGSCGGIDEKTLLAQSVTIHGKKKIFGVVSTLPPHVQKEKGGAPEIGNIFIDVGMSKEQAERDISLGDRITVNSEFRELCGDVVCAPALDDRSGICAVLLALDMLAGKALAYNLAVCFSCQEETGFAGAAQSAFKIQPDEAIAVDVSFGKTPDCDLKETAVFGSGVMIGFSPVLDKGMSNALRDLAKRRNIPFTAEVMSSRTGTNADAISVSGKGVKCCTLSFPIRYMHTSVENVNIKDIEAAAKLIFEYASGGAEND